MNATAYKAYARYNINDTMNLAFDFYGVDDDQIYDGLGYTTGLAFNASFDIEMLDVESAIRGNLTTTLMLTTYDLHLWYD